KNILSRFEEILEFADMHKFIDTPVKHYSSGQYTRLGFAVAAHLDHEILMVDEVLAVGDGVFQAKCLAKMRELVQDGRTVLLVSHRLDQVESVCDKLLWLDKGKMVAWGPTKTVMAQYRSHIDTCVAANAQSA
ncbi:MAG: ABC transporter ATP-binding protein, partial [Terriglobales bacterium]